MSYAESDLLPISGLQHLVFCERQCALIHVERLWGENRWTAEGRVLHSKAHDGKPETRDGERITRGLPLRSLQLGLSGVADIVLWRPPPGAVPPRTSLAAQLRSMRPGGLAGWEITPVEYKRGKPKANDCDRVQLCAQAMCLEEMLGVAVSRGQLYYGVQRRRTDVELDGSLRQTTRAAAQRFHALMAGGETPRAVREKKCDRCSLFSVCLPDAMTRRSAADYLRRQLVTEGLAAASDP
jgi:CRISPR-associated exonuclease Cas4